MMYPILCKVKFEELNLIFKKKSLWKQLLFSFLVNWIVAPLIMVFYLSKWNVLTFSWPWHGHFYLINGIIEKGLFLSASPAV
jgi:ACR3 family arsenite efflux pump ArsB